MSIKDIIRNLLVRSVKEVVPEAETSQGTALNDLLIEPNSLFLSEVFDLIGLTSLQLRISNAVNEDEALDTFAENWFIERKEGAFSSGRVRLFSSVAAEMYLPARSILVEREGFYFTNPFVFSLKYIEMNRNREDGLFFIDVDVRSEARGEKQIIADDSFVVLASPFPFVSARALETFYSGLERESNAEFAERIKKTISLRNLVNKRSIEKFLLENFDWVKKVHVVGFGDVEMQRDKVNFAEIANSLKRESGENFAAVFPIKELHVGNKFDIHCNYESLDYAAAVLTGAETDFKINYGTDNFILDISTLTSTDGSQRFKFPIYDIVGVQVLDEFFEPISLLEDIEEETIDCTNPDGFTEGMFSWFSLDPSLRFSPREKIGISLKSDLDESGVPILEKVQLQGLNIRIIYRYFRGLKEIQDMIYSSEERLVVADPLVKTFFPTVVDIYDPENPDESGFLKVKLLSGISIEYVEYFIGEYFKSLKDKIIISDFIAVLHQAKLVEYVVQPVILRVRFPRNDRFVGHGEKEMLVGDAQGTTLYTISDRPDSLVEEETYYYSEDSTVSGNEDFLTFFDLEKLGKRGADFISFIRVKGV